MHRRDILKGIGGAATATAIASQASDARADTEMPLPDAGGYADPWDPADPEIPQRQNISPLPD